MVRPPGEVERHTGPALGAFELRNRRDIPALGQSRIAGKKPNQSIAGLDRIGANLHAQLRFAEEIVRNLHNVALAIIAPAMISTGEIAAIHLAEGELELAVGTTALQGAESAVRAAIEHT